MLRKSLKECGYILYKTSYHRGYVSRKSDMDALPAEKYKGKYGEGYYVLCPCYHSTEYCLKEYWIKE